MIGTLGGSEHFKKKNQQVLQYFNTEWKLNVLHVPKVPLCISLKFRVNINESN